MPLTSFQAKIALLLAQHRSASSHLAGGAALHREEGSYRYSNDLDYFHDHAETVIETFEKDSRLLLERGFTVEVEFQREGFVRAIVKQGQEKTKIEWASDSAWRFFPAIADEKLGYRLHDIDLAINKLLALVGRDEARDVLDILEIHDKVLSLGALCWAAPSKDPGFTPDVILELLKRKGRFQQEDISRLQLAHPATVIEVKSRWLDALAQAENFLQLCPMSEMGALYYSPKEKKFVTPETREEAGKLRLHRASLQGALPVLNKDD